MRLPRLRQVVLAVADLDLARAQLEDRLGVIDPYQDPAVGQFGLRNAVYPLGDCFIELISPAREGTAVGRWLARGGSGGYMAMFEVADEGAARRLISRTGARVVHESRQEDIVDIHLHPKDMHGAIVAVDVARPPGSWRWGGPSWIGRTPPTDGSCLGGISVAVPDPQVAAARWGGVLGIRPARAPALVLASAGQVVSFTASGAAAPGIRAVAIVRPDRRASCQVAGVHFEFPVDGGPTDDDS
jgi:hypothetical protein